MAHCINIKHPEIKPLSEHFGISPKLTTAVIAVWQQKTGEMERFPTIEEFSNELQPVESVQPIEQPTQQLQVKEGVSELFENNPELADIGTPEQYSQYLDTIFPDSKVKDVVYHGTTATFEKFMKMYNNIHFGTLKAAKERLATIKEQRKTITENIYPVVLDIKTPIKTDADFDWELETAGEQPDPYELIKTVGYLDNWLYENGYLPKEESDVFGLPDKSIPEKVALWKNHDSYIYKNFVEDKGSTSYNVFEPEQIHILGSKQDIEGFKKFVKNNSTELQLKQIEQELKKEHIPPTRELKYEDSNILALMDRFGLTFKAPSKVPAEKSVRNEAKRINAILQQEGSSYEAIVTKKMSQQFGQPKEIWVVRFLHKNDKNTVVSDRYGTVTSEEAVDFVNIVTEMETITGLSKLIDNVLESGELTPEVQSLLELMKGLGLDIPISYINDPSSTALMSTDGISITINTAHTAHPKVWAEALVHELVHVTAENSLQTNDTFARRIDILYRKYLNRTSDPKAYGFTNTSEFLAEMMSNSQFREHLESLESIWSKFLRFFAELFGITKSSEMDKVTSEIKNIIEANSNKVTPFKRLDVKFSTTPKESMERILKSVSDRITTFQMKNKKSSLIAGQDVLLKKLAEQFDNAKYIQGMDTYTENVIKFIKEDDVFDAIDALITKAQNSEFDDIVLMGGRVRDLGTFIFSYDNITQDILETLARYQTKDADEIAVIEGIKDKIGKIKTILSEYKAHYRDLSHIIFSKFLTPFGMGESADQVKQALTTPVKDIGFATRWLMSLQESGDMILGMLDVAFKRYYNDARMESLNISKDLLLAKGHLENNGIKDTSWLYQMGDNNLPTGEYIIEQQTSLFIQERNKRFKELDIYKEEMEKAGTPVSEGEEKSHINKILRILTKKYDILNSGRVETAHYFDKYIAQKRVDLGADFPRWKAMNVFVHRDGSMSVSTLKNKEFDSIAKDPLKLDFYKKITKIQVDQQKLFPPKFRNYRIIPQIRKDVIERLKDGDMNRMKDAFTEMFEIKEDDPNYGSDFGIKDERGEIVNFIPIYFTKKLSNMQDLSLDAVSSMIIFSDMASRRNKLSQIVDILELGKEVIKDRGVFQTSNRGKILKTVSNIMGIKLEEDLTTDTPGNVYSRLKDFMDMMVYGKLKHDGVFEKSIDTFVHYTSVNNLALNLFAGIANINIGNTLTLIESIGGQFFDVEALAFAKKNYLMGVPGVLGDVGARMDKSFLGLWVERNNVLDDFEAKVWDVNADRTTKVEQLAGTSSLFVLNTMMEHGLHSEPALALAYNYRYDKDKGKFVFKDEFFEKLNEVKEKERLEVSKLTGPNLGDKVKEIRNKYKAQIESVESLLNDKWKAMSKDNYYYAFEKTLDGSRIKLKDIYKDSAQDAAIFQNRLHSLNHSLAGIYNKLDRSAAQKYAIGRAAFNFRKWMIPAINRRWKGYYKNYELQSEVEGYYNTSWRFMKGLLTDIKEGNASIMKSWYSLKDFEKANLKRAMAEMAIFIAALAVMTALSGLEGEDDDDWVLNMAIYQSKRFVTELGALTPTHYAPGEILKLLDSPIPAVNQFTELKKLIEFWNWFDELEAGKYKGMYKIERSLIRTIPPFKTVHDAFHPSEKIKFFNQY